MSENAKNYFFWNRQAFEESIKKFVCSQCPYVDPIRGCKNPDSHGCALFRHLPDLVRIAQRMKSPDLEQYREAVEKEAIFHCEHENSPDCALLDSPACGLDWLLPFLLKAVLSADKTLEARPDFRN